MWNCCIVLTPARQNPVTMRLAEVCTSSRALAVMNEMANTIYEAPSVQ